MSATEDNSPTSTSCTPDPVIGDITEELSQSALRDNIHTKGKNAYYYAHAHNANGPKWDGKIEPKLLEKTKSNISSASVTSNKAALMAKSNITNYAFLNEATKIKLYVNLPGVGNCPDDNITLDYTEQSLCLTIKNYVEPITSAKAEDKGKDSDELVSDTAPKEEDDTKFIEDNRRGEDRCLSFGKLYAEIDKATLKKKPDKVILILNKKDDKTWNAVCA